jgi:hypothetical protein
MRCVEKSSIFVVQPARFVIWSRDLGISQSFTNCKSFIDFRGVQPVYVVNRQQLFIKDEPFCFKELV